MSVTSVTRIIYRGEVVVKTGSFAKTISSINIPNWVIFLAALFNKQANEATLLILII
jgi:hypothetical protein